MTTIFTEIHPVLRELRARGDCDLRPCNYVSGGFKPIPPHKVGVAHLTLNPRFLLGDPVGCGKTPQALVAFAFLKEKNPALRLLVVTDKSAMFQWEHAVAKFLTGMTVEVIGFDGERRVVARKHRHARWASQADILIVNWHGMALDIDVALPNLKDAVVVLDEIQRVRDWRGRLIHPAARRLSLGARYVWGLSATPVYNRVEDLYGVMEVLCPGFFGPHAKFAATYLREVVIKPRRGRWFKKLVGYRNIAHLTSRLEPVYLKRPPDAFDRHLPGVVMQIKRLTMSDKQASAYQSAISQFFRGEPINKLTSLVYAQMVSDAPEALGLKDHGSSKLDELQRFFREDIDDTQKVVIYARYERVVTHVVAGLKAIGIKSLRITGKEGAAEREAAKTAFNSDPSVQAICINAAGGQAIDLQAAGILVFFDLPWSYGECQQVVGRTRRLGSHHPRILTLLLANEGTVDIHTLAILRDKEKTALTTMPKAAAPMDVDDSILTSITDVNVSPSVIGYLKELSEREILQITGTGDTTPSVLSHSEISQDLPAGLVAENGNDVEALNPGTTLPPPSPPAVASRRSRGAVNALVKDDTE